MKKKICRNSTFSLFSFQDIITGLCGIIIILVLIMLIDVITTRENVKSNQQAVDIHIVNDIEKLQKEIDELTNELEKLKEQTKNIIVNTQQQAPIEVQSELSKEISEKEKQLLALSSQIYVLKSELQKEREENEETLKNIRMMEETKRILESKLEALKKEKWITIIPERGESKEPVYLVLTNEKIEIFRPFKQKYGIKNYSFTSQKKDFKNEILNFDSTIHSFVILVRPSGARIMNEVVQIISNFGFTYGRDPLEEDVEIRLDNSL